MRMKLSLLTATIILLIACTPTIDSKIEKTEEQPVIKLNTLAMKMKEAMSIWDTEKAKDKPLDREKDGTWLDVGVRYKYFVLKDYVNIQLITKLAGVPIFKSGPHMTDMDYNSEEFGHYNPEFLTKVQNTLNDAMNVEVFNTIAQSYYDKELKNMARTYYRAYQHIKKSSKLEFDSTYDQEAFRSYADKEEKAGYDWYESVTAPGFWVRRDVDGTSKYFITLLRTVLTKYDKDFAQ